MIKKETPLIDENLLKLLVCPLTGGELTSKSDHLISNIGNLVYQIKDGIPVMIPEIPENADKGEK